MAAIVKIQVTSFYDQTCGQDYPQTTRATTMMTHDRQLFMIADSWHEWKISQKGINCNLRTPNAC